MKSKKLPKDTKVAVYIRVGREEQISPQQKLLDAVTEFIEKERNNADRSTEASQREVQQESNQDSH